MAMYRGSSRRSRNNGSTKSPGMPPVVIFKRDLQPLECFIYLVSDRVNLGDLINSRAAAVRGWQPISPGARSGACAGGPADECFGKRLMLER